MQVTQYTYQSPSTSAVQLGKLDQTSVEKESSTTTSELPKSTNETLSKAQNTQASQVSNTQEINPTITATKIDTYA